MPGRGVQLRADRLLVCCIAESISYELFLQQLQKTRLRMRPRSIQPLLQKAAMTSKLEKRRQLHSNPGER